MVDRNQEDTVAAKQRELLDALEEIFQKEGFRKVTMAELAARLRCSRRTFYELAGSKEELFLRVLERLLDRIRRLGDEAAGELEDPGARLEAFLRPGFVETVQASTTFFDDIDSFPSARRMMNEHQARRAESIRRIIEDGVRRGQLRRVNAYLVSEAARVVARRLKEPEFLRGASLSVGEAFREWTGLLLHGLLHSTSDEKRRRKRARRG
jgi:AcrR family transcriptional regulator